jgi:GlpG protein
MRIIGHIQDELQARTFADFLYVQGIQNQLEFQKSEGWAVWISEEDQLGPAGQLLDQFRTNPKDPQYQNKAKNAGDLRAQEDKTQAQYRKKIKDTSQLFRPLTMYGFGPLTFVLIAGSSIVFLLSRLGTDFAPIHALFISELMGGHRHWNSMLSEVRHGQVWRLFTPALIHMSFAHLLLNMLWLRDLGSMIEARSGSLQLLLQVAVIAVVSNVAQYYVSGPAFGGMSGVVYGLLGYAWIRGKLNPASGLFLHTSTVMMMLAWFVLCYTPLLTPLVGHVANTVHAAGLLVGMSWGFFSALSHR